MLSARNQLIGTVKSMKLGTVMADVIVKVGDFEIAAAITRVSAKKMKLKKGDKVAAVIKATEVMIAKD